LTGPLCLIKPSNVSIVRLRPKKFAIDNVRLNFTTSEENISNALEKINNMLG